MTMWLFVLSLWRMVASVLGGSRAEEAGIAHSLHRSGSRTNFVVREPTAHRSLVNMMVPGPRVAAMDRTAAICSATYSYDLSVPMEETVVEYYYAIESSENITVNEMNGSQLIRNLEETLFHVIHPAILWCYYDNGTVGKRKLEASREVHAMRRMTLEEARRLSIVTFSTTPEDEETTSTCFA